ncbi:hypothetical protein ACK2FW_03545 [Clostridioides difficile]
MGYYINYVVCKADERNEFAEMEASIILTMWYVKFHIDEVILFMPFILY